MREQRPRVVIAGGGFGGLAAAKALRRTPADVILIVGLIPAAAQGADPESAPFPRVDGGMPERLSRQVSPNAGTLWRPQHLQEHTNASRGIRRDRGPRSRSVVNEPRRSKERRCL
jgi:glycine/D-amino acid oxidase-like deaminating enzyme